MSPPGIWFKIAYRHSLWHFPVGFFHLLIQYLYPTSYAFKCWSCWWFLPLPTWVVSYIFAPPSIMKLMLFLSHRLRESTIVHMFENTPYVFPSSSCWSISPMDSHFLYGLDWLCWIHLSIFIGPHLLQYQSTICNLIFFLLTSHRNPPMGPPPFILCYITCAFTQPSHFFTGAPIFVHAHSTQYISFIFWIV